MHVRSAAVAVLVVVAGVAATVHVATQASSAPVPFTVHEWGTFTSIAGADGNAVQWLPQGGVSDLPCFVERSVFNIKGSLSGTVRMETPVLYFYAAQDVTVSVDVGFKQGVITEWYPHADVRATGPGTGAPWDGTIRWPRVTVSPSSPATFPSEPVASHYYQARNTDAVPVLSGRERERFLFYRGVGQFAPPLSATVVGGGRIVAWTSPGAPIADLILFENRGGAISYSVQHASSGRLTLDGAAVDDESTPPTRELVAMLIANGLYRKEAEAMVATWTDSWFEEGTRLFYIVPRPAVDAILPLAIAPAPAEIALVFVGRVELVTPWMLNGVRRALVTNNPATLARYGRFLAPIGERAIGEMPEADRPALRARLQTAARAWNTPPASCR